MTTPPTSYKSWISTEEQRAKALDILSKAALPFSVLFRRNNRTAEQNSRLWPIIRPITKALPLWDGVKMTDDKWKQVFVASMYRARKQKIEMVPTIENDGVVSLTSSSVLTVEEFRFLMDMIEAFASEHNIDIKRQD